MVRLASADTKRAVELLEQDHARKIVRQRHEPQRNPGVGPVEHLGCQANRTTDHEHQVARTVELQILEVRRELLARKLTAARIERHNVGGRRDGLEHVGALIGKGTCGVPPRVAVGHLDDAHLRVWLEALQVLVSGITPVALFELSDSDDGQLHCWAASEPTVTLKESVWSPRTISNGTTSPTL